jgi:capsular exopolysaccharide synthesis family protein
MSRIHDALRRAEEALRKDGNGSGPGSADTEQALEILEVLRVTEQRPGSLEAEAQGISSMPFDFDSPEGEPGWRPRASAVAPISEPPPVAPGTPLDAGILPDAILSSSRATAEDREVIPLPRAQAQRETAHNGLTPAPTPMRNPAPVPAAQSDGFDAQAPDTPITLQELASRCRKVEWKPDTQRMLSFDLRATNPVGLEEFRTLRSRLYQLRQRQTLSRLLITSALPGEGKTFVSANLAQVIVRQRGRKVLLIDCDLRLSRLHDVLGAPSKPGVTDYLKGEADEFEIVQRSPLENLYFVPGGRQLSNPADLLAGNQLARLMDRLSPLFDWVIVDTPPAVPIADASIIANLCHAVLIVVSSGKTPFDLAQKAAKEFRQTPILGTVLNRVPKSATYSRYYYSGYESQDMKKG